MCDVELFLGGSRFRWVAVPPDTPATPATATVGIVSYLFLLLLALTAAFTNNTNNVNTCSDCLIKTTCDDITNRSAAFTTAIDIVDDDSDTPPAPFGDNILPFILPLQAGGSITPKKLMYTWIR